MCATLQMLENMQLQQQQQNVFFGYYKWYQKCLPSLFVNELLCSVCGCLYKNTVNYVYESMSMPMYSLMFSDAYPKYVRCPLYMLLL